MLIRNLETPCILVDYDIIIQNIISIGEIAKNNNVELMPHIKTHKCPQIAKLQINNYSSGVTAAKLGEAEVMANNGINNIIIAYPIIGENKIERLFKLAKKINIKCGVDTVKGADYLSRYAKKYNRKIDVLLIVNTGANRCGVPLDDTGVFLAQKINNMKGVEIKGILTHEGHVNKSEDIEEIKKISEEAGKNMVKFKERLISSGVDISTVSVGSTPSTQFIVKVPGVTQIRPGTYVFNDYNQIELGLVGLDKCALTVVSTVVSKQTKNRAIIDAGSKTLTTELSFKSEKNKKSYGLVKNHDNVIIYNLSEEHGFVRLPEDSSLEVGDKIEIIPNHVCPVVNLFDKLFISKNKKIIDNWEIKARGKVT